jgi:tight adherence protein C
MTLDLMLPLVGVFISVAFAAGAVASMALAGTAPARRRMFPATHTAQPTILSRIGALLRPPSNPVRQLSKASRDVLSKDSRLRSRLDAAGWREPETASYYALAEIASPLLCGMVPLALFGFEGWLLAIVAAGLGYLVPDLVLTRATRHRQRVIQNGLPDALDLIVVCVEAGSSLDQAIVRASDELEFALPSLAQELRTVTSEIRAGKPRLEAFQGLAQRTGVEDIRALVAMLTQTDRFGTSIAQALRTHATTSRTKRRQRAEERAAKVGVKLVFPLALCFVPALYVVSLGPVVIRILRTLL